MAEGWSVMTTTRVRHLTRMNIHALSTSGVDAQLGSTYADFPYSVPFALLLVKNAIKRSSGSTRQSLLAVERKLRAAAVLDGCDSGTQVLTDHVTVTR